MANTIETVLKASASVAKWEASLAKVRAAETEACKALLEASGKGPYLVNGEELFILKGKGGSVFLSHKRGRKPAPKVEAAPAAATEATEAEAPAAEAAPEAEVDVPVTTTEVAAEAPVETPAEAPAAEATAS
jgi:hypothetical protein